MKPMGLRPVRFPGKRDCHPKLGTVNWWEQEMKPKKGKARERQRMSRELVAWAEQQIQKPIIDTKPIPRIPPHALIIENERPET